MTSTKNNLESLLGQDVEFATSRSPKATSAGDVRKAKDGRVVLCCRAGRAPRKGETVLVDGAEVGEVESVGRSFLIGKHDYVYVYFAPRAAAQAPAAEVLDEDEAAFLEAKRRGLSSTEG